MKHFLILTVLLVVNPLAAFACPKIDGLLDANCDGKIKITVFGDSIVRGVRDNGLNSETGGYLRILANKYTQVTFVNGGIPGVDSRGLFRAFVKNTPKQGKTYEALRDADVVMLGVGINDYWARVPGQTTIRNIQRSRDYIRKFSKKEFGISPFTMTIAVTNTSRAFQQPWVRYVNTLIYANKANLGPIVPFNNVPAKRILSDDGVHPNTAGYKRLSKVMASALKGSYNKLVKARNTDKDKDGVADWAEKSKFFTDPKNPDSDGDGFSDGDEIFVYFTDPLIFNESSEY